MSKPEIVKDAYREKRQHQKDIEAEKAAMLRLMEKIIHHAIHIGECERIIDRFKEENK